MITLPLRILLTLTLVVVVSNGCSRPPQTDAGVHERNTTVLKALADPTQYRPRKKAVVYVPVYSSIDIGFDKQVMDLSVTLSIRNVSSRQPLVVHSVRYFDSGGKEVRQYVSKASSLAPMATADFVVQRRDSSGGRGASFLVEWSSSEPEIDEPYIEAVMIGHQGSAGVSFTSTGKVLSSTTASPAPAAAK